MPYRAAVLFFFAASVTAQGWTDVTPPNPLSGPPNRAFAAMCWDSARGYVLLTGGIRHGGNIGDTWSWDGTSWTQHAPSLQPMVTNYNYAPARCAMAFHAPTNEALLVVEDSTYTWTGTNWVAHSAPIGSGNFGSPANIALGHDPVRTQTVLFVGSRQSSQVRADVAETYVWDGFAWSPRPTGAVPYPLDFPTMAFDPATGRLVLATSGNGFSAFFEWTGTNWQQRFPAAPPTAAGAMATDTANQRIVMLDGDLAPSPNHTWTLGDGEMERLTTPIEPARRFGAAMAFDPIRQRIVLFGGTPNWPLPFGGTLTHRDTWEFEFGAGASYATYGAGCAGSRGVPALAARAGSEPRIGRGLELDITNLPFTGAAFLFLGISDTTFGPTPLPFPLAGLGAPGCSILASGEAPYLLTNLLGSATWQWSVPNMPGVSVYNQAFAFDPAANALGISASNGGHAVIGF